MWVLSFQSSEKLYEDDFSSVSNLLGEFFQKTFNLQKIFSAILGKSKVASDSTAQEDNYVKGIVKTNLSWSKTFSVYFW